VESIETLKELKTEAAKEVDGAGNWWGLH
jgi:hypothetical protein